MRKEFVRLTRAQKMALLRGPFSLEVEVGSADRRVNTLLHVVVRDRAGREVAVLASAWLKKGDAIVLDDFWPEGANGQGDLEEQPAEQQPRQSEVREGEQDA